jgi:UDP:flavonoid glycosyltransferase YjiC (YdhE family)
MAKLDPAKFLLPRVLDALVGEADIEVVAAVSSAQRGLVGDRDDVEVLVDASIDDVFRQCDLVVAHGGAATVLTALRHGLPMLLVPQLPDHAGHAARVLATGAGEVLTRDQADGDRIRTEVVRLLDHGQARSAAQALAGVMRAAPAPTDIVREIEHIARR